MMSDGALTQTTELADDGGQGVVGHTLQLTVDSVGHCTVAKVPGLNVSLDQRHDPVSRLHPQRLLGDTGQLGQLTGEDVLLQKHKAAVKHISLYLYF